MPIREEFEHADVQGARVGRFGAKINTTFILYRIGTTIIDAGPPNQWRACREFFDRQAPERLLLTHHHEDHAGNAVRVAHRYGLKPLAPELSRAKLARGYRIPLAQRIIWGTLLPVETDPLPEKIDLGPDGTLVPIHTPGHAKDLYCLWWPERGFLFGGDLYVSKSITHLRSDENLQQTMESLVQMIGYDIDVLFCSHRGIVQDGRGALRKKLEHFKNVCARSQEFQAQGIEEDEIVRRVLGPEDAFSKGTFYNISKRNLIRQALTISWDNF